MSEREGAIRAAAASRAAPGDVCGRAPQGESKMHAHVLHNVMVKE
jgi:hypothetical protein